MMEQEKGLTLGKVFKVAFRRWVLLIPVSLIVAGGTLAGLLLGYNGLKGSYKTTFSYSAADLMEEKYADGSSFFYRDIISYENLNKIKESQEKYSGINVDKIVNQNAIGIEKDVVNDTNSYTITLKTSFIKDNVLAKDFLDDLINNVLVIDKEIVDNGNFDSPLKSLDKADTFEKQISLLDTQANNIIDSYNRLESNGKLSIFILESIATNKSLVSDILGEDFVSSMNFRITKGGYVKDYDSQEAKSYQYQKESILEKISYNEKKIVALNDEIKELKDIGASISVLSEKVVDLVLQNSSLSYDAEALQRKIDNKGVDPSAIDGYNDFVKDIASYKESLSTCVDEFKILLNDAYIKDAKVSYQNTNIVEVVGTMNTFVAVGIALVFGLTVGIIVNLIVDRKKLYE